MSNIVMFISDSTRIEYDNEDTVLVYVRDVRGNWRLSDEVHVIELADMLKKRVINK